MYDARTKLADQVAAEVREHFGEKVCRQIVPRTVRLSEAPRSGSRSSRSIRAAGAPSPTGSWPRRSAVGRRSGLGKGLGALIPATERMEDTDAALRELPLSEITPNTYQPRGHFDEEALVSLAASIQAVGRAAAGPGPPDRCRSSTSSSPGSGAGGPPGGPGSRRSRPSCARPRTCARSSRRWSRTSTARTSRRSRRRRPTSSWWRSSATPRRRSPSGSARAGPRWPTPCGCSTSRPASSGCWPRGRSRPATPGPCSARPIGPSRSSSPERSCPST